MLEIVNQDGETLLVVDGAPISKTLVSVTAGADTAHCSIKLMDISALDVFEGLSLSDFPGRILDIGLNNACRPLEFTSVSPWITFNDFDQTKDGRDKVVEVTAYVDFSWFDWAKPWSVGALRRRVEQLLPSWIELRAAGMDEEKDPTFALDWDSAIPARESIAQGFRRVLKVVTDLLEEADRLARPQGHLESIVETFSFPEEVRAPCEQYLAFFAEFLRGLGLSATADITHNAGEVLFTVTPTDGKEALSIIREALGVYLEIASVRNVADLGSFADDVRMQQLVANVQHLQSQLTLQRAIVATQDVTIARLAQANAALALFTDGGNVLQRSITRPVDSRAEEAVQPEHLAGGLITIRPTEFHGVQVNLPGMVRMLRERIGKWRLSRQQRVTGK